MKVRAIEITFPVEVDLSDDEQRDLVRLASLLCKRWERKHPYSVMWAAGIGQKPTFIPMTPAEEAERGIEFDEQTFAIECFERENYDCPGYEG